MKNYQLLNQFIDRKCEVSFHYLTDDKLLASYNYNSFSYELNLDDKYICLLDQNDEDCRTYISLDKVIEVSNILDDLYSDVVNIKFNDRIIGVCCAEKRPVPVICNKCKHEFQEDDQIWYINQQGEYGSVYDGEWISKRLCDNCVSLLVNSD